MVFFTFMFSLAAEDDYLKISVSVEPRTITQGEEGMLHIKITPKDGIRISSHPEFLVKLDKSNNFTFPKLFFTASELDFRTLQENDAVYLDLEKEINIMFKVNEDSMAGKNTISGEVVFTAVLKDNWSVKTYQKFNVDYFSMRNQKAKPKRK